MNISESYTAVAQTLFPFYVKVLNYKFPDLSGDEIQSMAATATNIAVTYVKAHPLAGLTVLSVGLSPILGPGWLTTGILRVFGFGPLGPIAGKKK